MGPWIGMIGAVARKICCDGKAKYKGANTVFLGLNLNTNNFKLLKDKSESKSYKNFYLPGATLLSDNLSSA